MAGIDSRFHPYAIPASHHRALIGVLKTLQTKSHCSAAILADNGGTPIGFAGALKKQAVPLLTALAAGNYSATRELSRLIGETNFATHFHEGNKRSMYFVAIDDNYFLFLLYPNDITLGMIRVLAAQARAEIQAIFATLIDEPNMFPGESGRDAHVASDEFQQELTTQLNSVLGRKHNP